MGFLDNNGLSHFWKKIKQWTIPTKSLTKAEYNALSEEEKMADVEYIITDDNSDSTTGGGGGEIYSTDETRIGTWIDGKPLYRKAIVFSGVHVYTSFSSLFTIEDNVETFIKCFGQFTIDEEPGLQCIIPFTQSKNATMLSNINLVWLSTDNKWYLLGNWEHDISITGRVLAEYTKTTD